MRPVNKTCMYGPQHSKRSLFFFLQSPSALVIAVGLSERDNQTPKGYQKKKKRNADVQHQIPVSYTHLDVYKRQALHLYYSIGMALAPGSPTDEIATSQRRTRHSTTDLQTVSRPDYYLMFLPV